VILDDSNTQQNLQSLWARLEAKLESFRTNSDFLAARVESDKLLKAIMNDPISAKLVTDCKKLLFHLRSFRPGHALDPALLSEMRGLLVPLLLEHLSEVAVPEITDITDTAFGKFEYHLANIKIAANQLIPENIHIKFKYDLDAHPLSLSSTNHHLVILLKAKNIQVNLNDVAWSYSRLSSPHLHDSGHANLKTEGKGASVRLRMEVNQLSEQIDSGTGKVIHNKEIFHVLESCCHVDRWAVTFSDSKHDTLYEMLSSLFSTRIKRHFEELVVSRAKDFAEVFNHRIYVLYNEARLKTEEFGYLAELKKDEASLAWAETKSDLKESLLHSAPAEALKDAAIEKGKEAIKIGLQRTKEAPDLGTAISRGLSDIKESLDGTDLLKGLSSSSEFEDKSDYHRTFRESAPVPAATFVSASESDSRLKDVPNAAKYPASVVAPQKREEPVLEAPKIAGPAQ